MCHLCQRWHVVKQVEVQTDTIDGLAACVELHWLVMTLDDMTY